MAVQLKLVCGEEELDLAGRTVVVTDTPSAGSGQSVGRMTRTFYDALGRVRATVNNWNPDTLNSPDDCVLSPTNESVENVCTLYGYDAAGNRITTTNALNQTSLTVYDEINRPVISVANWDGESNDEWERPLFVFWKVKCWHGAHGPSLSRQPTHESQGSPLAGGRMAPEPLDARSLAGRWNRTASQQTTGVRS